MPRNVPSRALELKLPPVAVFLLCAAGAFGLRRLAPALESPAAWTRPLALLLAIAGLAIGALGVIRFVRLGTTVHPNHPERASRVVSSGVYRFTRNPMYLGLALLLVALAAWWSHPLALLSVPAFVLYMNRFQILPEERALLAKFGDDYAAYLRSVRRWI